MPFLKKDLSYHSGFSPHIEPNLAVLMHFFFFKCAVIFFIIAKVKNAYSENSMARASKGRI